MPTSHHITERTELLIHRFIFKGIVIIKIIYILIHLVLYYLGPCESWLKFIQNQNQDRTEHLDGRLQLGGIVNVLEHKHGKVLGNLFQGGKLHFDPTRTFSFIVLWFFFVFFRNCFRLPEDMYSVMKITCKQRQPKQLSPTLHIHQRRLGEKGTVRY